ncbi:MAG: phosphatase PAP2 family protein [Ruminococcus sp.]|nr:phosphatase PAP2 family protein [Candidatus Apopatosoma intestinale]
MEKELKENRVKTYGIIIGVISLAAQHGIYLLSHFIATLIGIAPFSPKIEAIDGLIPLLPIFIIPYIWSYLYWAMGPMAVSKCKYEHFLNFMAAYLCSCLLGGLVLIFAPTYMDRVAEGLTDTSAHTGFFADLMRFWYTLDGSDMAYNLFPSFHCSNSTICMLGVLGRKEIPLWYRIYSVVITFVIFASTVCVKQHFFIDIIGGVVVAIIAYTLCTKLNAGRLFLRPIAWFKEKFGKTETAEQE